MDEITNSDSRAKHNKPLPSCYMSEEDKSDLLEDKDKQLYMRFIDILQWIVSIGTIDIFSVNVTSKFHQYPHVDQLNHTADIFYYLR